MPTSEFSLILEGSIRSLFVRARQALEEAGGALVGDERRGEFSVPTPHGEVRGLYQVEGVTGDFCITERPLALSCDAIKRFLAARQGRHEAAEPGR